MRTFSKWTALAALFILVSCNQIEDFGDFSLRHKHGVLGEIAPVVFDDELGTKATIDPSSMGYRFEQGDHINVWSNSGTLLIYTVQEVTGGGTGAKFAGGGYTLTEGETYYSSVPLIKTFTENYHSLGLTYKGQVQVADNDADNCAEYTYTYASSTCNNGDASFSFNRMNAYMMFKLTLPENLTLKELQISVDDESFFALDGTADIATGAFTAGTKSGTMTLKLGGDAGIQVTDGVLNAFLSVAPCAAGEYVIRVIDSEDNIYTSPKISKTALEASHVKLFETEVFKGENPGVAKIDNTVYASLAEAVAAVPADGTATTITMLDNEAVNVVGSAITIESTKNIILDLNGHQVVGTAEEGSTSALITNKGTLTIKDSSDTNKDGTGNGQLISGATTTWIYEGDGNYAGSYASNTITNTGVLTIESGYVENLSTGSATYAVDNNSSGADAILNVKGGMLKAHSVAIREFANSTAKENTINVSGGTISAGYSGIWIQLPGSDATKAMKAALNVTGGTLEGGSYAFYDYSYGNSFDATQYNLNGGTYNGYIFSYGANISITSGTYNGDVAIKQAKPSTVSVSGGMFAGDVYTYGANASTGFISGGIFATTTYEEDGETLDCDWPSLVADGYIAGDNTDPATMSDYPYAVVVDTNVYVATIGGTKYLTLAAAIAAVQDGQTITLLENITLTEDLTWNAEGDASFTLNFGEFSITKGNFSIKVKPGQTVYTDKTSTTGNPFTAIEGYVLKSSKDENGKYYFTVEEADYMFTRSSNGAVTYYTINSLNGFGNYPGTFKLLKDATRTSRTSWGANSDVTLDLNGHTLTYTSTDASFVLSTTSGSESSPKPFKIVDDSETGGGKLVMNAELEITGRYYDVTIGEGVTVEGNSILIDSKFYNKLTVEGTIKGGDNFTVVTNGNTENANINIKSGAVLTSNGVTMYLPGTGTTTIEDGATITGSTAIYVKSGILNIEGGEINGNGEKKDYEYWNNGCHSTGDALVVENCGYPGGAPTVNVTGGTFTSTNAEAIASYSYGDNDPIAHFVHGGYFSSELDRTICEEGKKCVPATEKPGYFKLGEIEYVAKIGSTDYETLQTALDAAHEMTGDVTITLIADATGYSIVHQKAGLNVTIDGAQKTVDGQIIIDGDGRASGTETVTISNIKFQGDNTNFVAGTDAFVLVPSTKDTGKPYTTGKYNYAHNVTVSNCSFTSTASSLTIVAFKSTSGAGDYNTSIIGCTGTNLHSLAQFTGTTGGAITNNTVTASESFVNVSGGTGSFAISGNTFTTSEGSDGYGIRENASSTAVLNLSENNFTAFNSIKLGKSASATNGTINVTSGTYNGTIVKDIAATATGKIVISGGSFDVEPSSEFIAEGYKAVLENGRWVIVEKLPEAKIGDVEYATLQTALDAAHEMTGDVTITLIADATGYSIVHQKAGLNVIIDGAQKTVSGQIIIDGDNRNAGTETLTITNVKFQDDKTNFSAGTDAFILVPSLKTAGTPYYNNKNNYAHNITVSNCSFTSTSSALDVVGIKTSSGGGSAYNVVVTGCTGTNLHSLAQLTGTTDGAFTNNTVSASESFVNVSGGGGTFAVTGNTFTTTTGSDGYGIRENGTSSAVINLTNNIFTAFDAVKLGKNNDVTAGTINVISGTYNGNLVKQAAATGSIVITGGTFSVDPSAYVADGYQAVQSGSNYTVQPK